MPTAADKCDIRIMAPDLETSKPFGSKGLGASAAEKGGGSLCKDLRTKFRIHRETFYAHNRYHLRPSFLALSRWNHLENIVLNCPFLMRSLESFRKGNQYDLVENGHGEHRGSSWRSPLRGWFRRQGHSALDANQDRKKCAR